MFPYSILSGTALLIASTLSHGAELERVRTVSYPHQGEMVKAEVGADGIIHAIYNAGGTPRYTFSTNNGMTFSAPLEIVDAGAKKPGLEFEAWDLAVGSNGRVHVAMGNNAWKLKLPQEQWSFHYATLAPGAREFEPVRNLNRKPSEGFSLAANEKSDVAAAFLSGKLFTMVSHDEGNTFTEWKELNPSWNPCDCCTTAAAFGADGRLAILYREETNNDRDMYVALWDQRGGTNLARHRISETSWKIEACPMTYFTIKPTQKGFIAAWPTKGQIYFARLDSDGNVLPPGEIKTPGKNGMRTGILALSAADGFTLVGWKNNDQLGWQLYDRDGRPNGKPGSSPSRGKGAAGVVLKNGSFLLFP